MNHFSARTSGLCQPWDALDDIPGAWVTNRTAPRVHGRSLRELARPSHIAWSPCGHTSACAAAPDSSQPRGSATRTQLHLSQGVWVPLPHPSPPAQALGPLCGQRHLFGSGHLSGLSWWRRGHQPLRVDEWPLLRRVEVGQQTPNSGEAPLSIRNKH